MTLGRTCGHFTRCTHALKSRRKTPIPYCQSRCLPNSNGRLYVRIFRLIRAVREQTAEVPIVPVNRPGLASSLALALVSTVLGVRVARSDIDNVVRGHLT